MGECSLLNASLRRRCLLDNISQICRDLLVVLMMWRAILRTSRCLVCVLVFPVDLANMMHEGAAFVASDRGGEVGTAWRKERPGALNSARLNRFQGVAGLGEWQLPAFCFAPTGSGITGSGITGTGEVSTSHDGNECRHNTKPHICVNRCGWWWLVMEKANGGADVGSFQLGELLRVSQWPWIFSSVIERYIHGCGTKKRKLVGKERMLRKMVPRAPKILN